MEETMDRKIVDNRKIKPKHYKYIAVGSFILIIILILIFRDNTSTFKVGKDTLTIEKVFRGPFQDYRRIIGQVEPISIIYLDAVEGGMVDKILIEEGSLVKAGDIILKLSNSNLNLSILNSEAQLAEKANFLRETQLNMQQQMLTLQRDLLQLDYDLIQKKRVYERNKILIKDELISKEEYLLSEEDYQLTCKMKQLTIERTKQDSAFRRTQVSKISENLRSMQTNLELVYQQRENLNIKAPVDGQLGLLNADLGQSISPGQRIGQVNVLTTYKIKAQIDEHYIDRIVTNLTATFERQNDTFNLVLTKVYPEVRDGKFEVDLQFAAQLPENIRSGQSYHISLQLGETQEALQVSRGGFFQSTGGQWVFVVSQDGKYAKKRNIKIGKQNPLYYEIIEGLEEGESVVVSGYDMFGDNERLIFK